MKALSILLGFITLINIFAQDIEYYTPPGQDVYQEKQQRDDSIFKFAWDVPHYGYTYEIAQQDVWIDPSSGGLAVIAFFFTRHENNGDSMALSGYAAFRPFVLDYNTYSFAFGVSYFGAIQDFDEPDNVANNQDAGGVLANITAQDINADLNYQAFNFSLLGSFPEIGFQFVFEIGYLLSNLRTDIEDINVIDAGTNGALLDLTESNHRFKQRDHSLYMSLELRQIFDRDFFNLFSLYMYSNINLNSERRKSTADVNVTILGINDNVGRVEDLTNVESVVFGNLGNLDPEDDTLDVTYLGAFFTTRLINIPLGLEFFGERSGIAIDSINGIEYGYGELLGSDVHGAALQAGGQVSFFGFFSVSFINTWHQRNDFDDEWSLTFSLGLYGAVAPDSTQRVGAGIQAF